MAEPKPDLSFNWSTPVKIPEGDPPISHDDTTPEVSEQAKANGWTSDYYNFGKAEGKADWFNPSMVQRSDGLWLLVRGSEPHPQGFQFGQNDIWAFKMDLDGITPTKGQRLKWLNKEPSQHFEDPRGFYHPKLNQTIIAVCTFCWYPNQPWTGAHQLIGSFNSDWECRGMKYPIIGGAPGQMQKIDKHENYQKNWSPFLHDGKLHILYKSKPWMIYSFRDTWSDFEVYTHESGVEWQWGDIRGGTPPVRVGDYYFTFHHSSLPWRGRYRRYYAGCIAFEAKPPFRPKLMTPEPMLQGSQNSVWSQRKPLVVFPCGSIFKNGQWLISMGINDLKSAWVKCSHESILALMKPIGQADPVFFSATGLSDGERAASQTKPDGLEYVETSTKTPVTTLEKRRAALVKARAARAAKRSKLVVATNGDASLVAASQTKQDGVEYGSTSKPKRRHKRRKRASAEAKVQALLDYQEKKRLQSA